MILIGGSVIELSIAELQEEMQAGRLTSEEVVAAYIDRIGKLDKEVGSVTEINPEAGEIAKALDDERGSGSIRGPLHGIPILLKENIDTADRMQTTSGSLALEGHFAEKDAHLVTRLRSAGAVILGKTNLSEWANFRSTHSTSGWSSRGGLTRNPYALDRSACGSSSGSGAAVAANFCTAAVGTETDGSVICPAQTNGIVGIKPTLGLVSRSGIIPIAHSQDTAGPMTRTVADAAFLLSAMCGADPADTATAESERYGMVDLPAILQVEGLAGARIGVSRNYWGFDSRVDAIMEHSISVIKSLGAEIIDPANVDNEQKYSKGELEVLLYEFHADLDAYLAAHPGVPAKSMSDVISFNENNKARLMPFFGHERMQQAVKKGDSNRKRYLKALERNQRLSKDGIDNVLKQHHLDAIIAPTGGPAWTIDLVNGDNYRGGGFSSPAAVAGYPHITVPAGRVFGLPVGLSFFGTAWTDWNLIRFAFSFEQATKVRKPPQFLETANMDSAEYDW